MMPDREKVIHHFEDAIEASGNGALWRFVRVDIIKDAIALLKTQEPVRPVKQIEQTEWTVCGNCRNHLISKWIFCPYCGRTVSYKQTSDS